MARSAGLDRIRRDVEKNYATCYWSETSLTKDRRVPSVKTIEPKKFLDRIVRALTRQERYVWMVTVDGSSDGSYGNCANAFLVASFEEAKSFVDNDIRECILNDKVVNPRKHTKADMDEAVAEHVEWFGDCEAQYRYYGSVTDWKIEKVSVPRGSAK